jgi:hypothetical protein
LITVAVPFGVLLFLIEVRAILQTVAVGLDN